ncbi:MAG: DUF3047 domain-containing protein [Thermodesulfobacteriota bacterium]|nr:DUF3047 domain-containing protein [Thermodesulfobacteriota bacterium]
MSIHWKNRAAVVPIVMLILLMAFTGAPAVAQAQETLPVGLFSRADSGTDSLPPAWEPLTFDDIEQHTRYDLVQDGDTAVVRARSNASASGMIRKMKIDPRKFPVIQWRWKITDVLKKGDVTRKSGDDYPARIYIAFEYDPDQVGFWERTKFGAIKALYGEYPPVAAINYIWGSNAPKGTRVANPYTDRVMMIVVENGAAEKNTWVTETRNIYEDYKAAFGEEPPMISGVAIMTDTDNTGESAVSYYGDIVFKAGE